MRLIIVSGLSGAGKSIALHTLEDEGFYCIDNLPAEFVHILAEKIARNELNFGDNVAVGVDIRSVGKTPAFNIEPVLSHLKRAQVETSVVFMEADEVVLLRRYSEARRPHPLAHKSSTLEEAIDLERSQLDSILMHTDLKIDTTNLNQHQLGVHIRSRLCGESKKLSVLIQSFGYKKGVPLDSDFVFDVRCLLNPYWKPELRKMTGHDPEVVKFLESDASCAALFEQICNFIKTWLDRFEKEPRSCLTLSIGCTGGQHRSVYMVERLYAVLADDPKYRLAKHHRELS